MLLLFNDARYSPDASSNVNYLLFVADVKCVLCKIGKNNIANATHAPVLVQKMFGNRTEAMLDQKHPRPGPGRVLTLPTLVPIEIPYASSC